VAVRTTVELPEDLHEELRRRAENAGTSVQSLIVFALEQAYKKPKKPYFVTGPLVKGKGKLGPLFPVDDTPHDLILP
jgi:hypothetical protein